MTIEKICKYADKIGIKPTEIKINFEHKNGYKFELKNSLSFDKKLRINQYIENPKICIKIDQVCKKLKI